MPGPLSHIRVLDLSRILAGPWASQILADLGVHDMILLTNSHRNIVAVEGYGLKIVGERAVPEV